jgi:hypothetical protein
LVLPRDNVVDDTVSLSVILSFFSLSIRLSSVFDSSQNLHFAGFTGRKNCVACSHN